MKLAPLAAWRSFGLAWRINTARLGPAEIGRLAGRAACRTLTGARRPLWIMIGVTARCQCRCVHCASRAQSDEPPAAAELTLAEIDSIAAQAAALGAIKAVLFGGEPLTRPDIAAVVRTVRRRGLAASLNTNGLALDPPLIARLKAAGLGELQVSLDSANPERHDELRGRRGSFRRACRAVADARAAGLPVVISTYAAPAAVDSDDLARIIRLGRELRASAVRIVQPIAAGRWLRRLDCLLSPAQEAHLRALIEPGFVYADDQKGGYRICAALRRDFLHVSPDGDVLPCCYVPLRFGSVRREPLAAIWRRMIAHPIYRLPRRGCPMNRADFRSRYVDGVPLESRSPFPIEELV